MVAPVAEFFAYVLSTSVVYILAGLGMSLAGRTGIFLVFNEGVMLASASVGFLVTYFTNGNLAAGILAGALLAGAFGLLFCVFSVRFKQNQFVVGLTLFIMASGLANYLYGVTIPKNIHTSIPTFQGLHMPLLSDVPDLGPILFSQNVVFYVSIALAVAFWFLLFKTNYGLNVRSVGENPRVADTLGINVFRTKYVYTIIGSILMGAAGAYLPLYFTGSYAPSLVNGRGWIVIAVALLANWSPIGAVYAGLIFSGFEVFSYYGQLLNLPIHADFLLMVPFVATLAILIQVYRTAELPRGLGRTYDRESVEE